MHSPRMNKELLSCPICKNVKAVDVVSTYGMTIQVYCADCYDADYDSERGWFSNCIIGMGDNEDQAIEDWNFQVSERMWTKTSS